MTTPAPRPVEVTLVVGSARDGRLAPDVAGWFRQVAARRDDLVIDVVDVADTPCPRT